ncbi:uncharacterized protein [Palaemon carinicauda]|uniref:uncharacterized protein n=1 Tax=Palaemon carinicauda TaxID=392227 RepID=UPI0035B5D2D4
METPRSVLLAVRRNDWFFSLDLKDAYLQVPIHPQSRHLLRFCWEQEVWQFKALCFGLTTAPQVFTRLMAPVGAAFHKRGIRMVEIFGRLAIPVELRTGSHLHEGCSSEIVQQTGHSDQLREVDPNPQSSFHLSGNEDRLLNLKAFPTQDRIQTLQECIKLFLTTNAPSSQTLDETHRPPVVANSVSSQRKEENQTTATPTPQPLDQEDHHFQVQWTETIRQSLIWWSNPVNLNQGLLLSTPLPDIMLFSDASDSGWGASIGDQFVSGTWTAQELEESINWRETQSNTACSLSLQPSVPFKSRRSVRRQLDGYFLHKEGRRDEGPRSWTVLPKRFWPGQRERA